MSGKLDTTSGAATGRLDAEVARLRRALREAREALGQVGLSDEARCNRVTALVDRALEGPLDRS